MKRLFYVVIFLSLALVAGGCSTWRCRGFVDSMVRPILPSRDRYVIESLEFRKLAMENAETREDSPKLAWLSEQNTLIGTSYLEDLSKAIGATNDAPDAVKINISIVPMRENRFGKSSIGWPLCCTLGVFPCHFVEELPFDVIVRFDVNVPGRSDLPTYSCATGCVAQVRADSQYGLTRMDMDTPPPAQSAVGELRDDGTVGTGRELRMERLRSVFVQTVAAVVSNAIAKRESAEFVGVDQAATEFGPIAFPAADDLERQNTKGWGLPLMPPKQLPPEPLGVFLRRVWDHPQTQEQVRLKRLVETGIIQKDEWTRQMTDIWKRSGGGAK